MSDTYEWSQLTPDEKKQLHPSRLGRTPTKTDIDNLIAARTHNTHTSHIQGIIQILYDVTQGSIAIDRAERIATVAIDLALRNLEQK